jgi:hypothetical protein
VKKFAIVLMALAFTLSCSLVALAGTVTTAPTPTTPAKKEVKKPVKKAKKQTKKADVKTAPTPTVKK